MKKGTRGFYIKNLDDEARKKALFVVKAKGSSLSEEVRKAIENIANEYEDYIKELYKVIP